MRFIITLAQKYPWQTVFMVLALLLAGMLEGIGLSLLLPLLSMAVDSHPGNREIEATAAASQDSQLEQVVSEIFAFLGITPTLETLLVLIICAIVLKSVMMLVAKKQVGYTVARVATDLRLALLRALMATRWEHYLSQPVGLLANAMATEANRASRAYMSGIMMMAFIIQAIVYSIIALLVSWKVTVLALGSGIIILYLLKRFVQKARKAGLRRTQLLKSLLALMTDALQSIKPLKAMGRENLADYLLETKTNRLNRALQKQVFNKEALKAFQEPLMTILLAVGLYAVLVYWHLPMATVMILVYLSAQLLRQLNKIQERYQEMAMFESAYWSLHDTIQEVRLEKEQTAGDVTPSLNHEIRIDQVSFAYGDKWILRNASLKFPVGMITAIIGPSGSGKTTVVDLMTGLLRPQQGEVWIDDLPLANVSIRHWRRMIGYIPQETILLHDSVFNNVILGDTALDEKAALTALRAAGAWEFVKDMPQGMHSMVGERGGKLSGGQRQRIAIARALVNKPKLLILDEATSALDPEAESAICDTLLQLRGKLTILAISHQPALLTIADHAYRVHEGEARVVAIDPPNDAAPVESDQKKVPNKVSLTQNGGESF
jgi:ATP-binding cassette subfamily C protein